MVVERVVVVVRRGRGDDAVMVVLVAMNSKVRRMCAIHVCVSMSCLALIDGLMSFDHRAWIIEFLPVAAGPRQLALGRAARAPPAAETVI